MVDALSQRHALFSKLGAQILGFENIPKFCERDQDFASSYANCKHKGKRGLYISEGYLFREGKICIPQGTYRKLLVKETHEGDLKGHFGIDRILDLLKGKIVLAHMRKDV